VSAASAYDLGGGYRNALVNCPAGKRVIGGGAAVEGVAGPQLNTSAPTAASDGWRATGFAATNFGAWQVTVFAVCAATT